MSFLSGNKRSFIAIIKLELSSLGRHGAAGQFRLGCVWASLYGMGKVHVGNGACGDVSRLLNLPISEMRIRDFIERNIFKCYGQNHVMCEKYGLEHMDRSVN